MAFYKFNRDLPSGASLRTGLDSLRQGRDILKRHMDAMNQMSNAQITDVYGVAPTTVNGSDADAQSAALKAELAADVSVFLTDGSQDTVMSKINQLLAQTG